MPSLLDIIEKKYKKPHVVDVRSGDTVKVHQKIREAGKERVQIFEGLVIRTKRKNSHTASVTVRRLASGVGVEKTYLIHSPQVTKIQVVKRSKVRRNYLSYMRQRTGKSARLSSIAFDQEEVNKVPEPPEKQAESEKPEEKTAEPKDAKAEKPEAKENKSEKPAKTAPKEEK
jgi:large subunit ribosomal protein L19